MDGKEKREDEFANGTSGVNATGGFSHERGTGRREGRAG